jgi:hypothetical protein
MTAVSLRRDGLRLNQPDFPGLILAFSLSLAVHLLLFGGYQAANRHGWLEKVHLPDWLKQVQSAIARLKPEKNFVPVAPREVPLMFVEVNPAAAPAEAPKKAKYYSNKSSRAANPGAAAETDVPKIAGTQELVTKTETTPRREPAPLQPAPAVSPPEESAQPQRQQPRGELALAKPTEHATPQEGMDLPRPRPRTIAEALARPQAQALAGEKMKQAGGVRRRALDSSLDVMATPFGAYDAAIVAAIQSRWYALLDSRDFVRDRTGKVVLQFHLNYDGTISDMAVEENTVGELLCLLCQKAVLDPAPYAAWPGDMRRKEGRNFRDVRFTFYYY